MQRILDSPFVPKRFKDAIRVATKERMTVPFQEEDGVVHLVIAEFETLCDLLVATGDERADIQGSFVHRDTLVTCLSCLAEEA